MDVPEREGGRRERQRESERGERDVDRKLLYRTYRVCGYDCSILQDLREERNFEERGDTD